MQADIPPASFVSTSATVSLGISWRVHGAPHFGTINWINCCYCGSEKAVTRTANRPPKRACPAYKEIPGTDFVAMAFNTRTAMTQNHFLTHFHSDHYGGIIKAWNSTIYCSVATANLVNQQLGIDRKWLHPLPMLTPVVIESRGKPVTVTPSTPITAPVPSFCSRLVVTRVRNIFFTLRFRWNREFMMTQAPLRPFARGELLLDEIFFDTYCDPKYTLPSQKEAIEETIKVMKQEVARAKLNKSRMCSSGRTPLAHFVGCGIS
jgi:DNA cross-link repair 1A protein